MDRFKHFLCLILVLITFASFTQTKPVIVSSFNLHGFSASSKYLSDCIASYGGVWMIQEHWLSEHQLQQLQQLNVQFVARSGMENAVSSGIYRGRPFGGVSICWSSDLNRIITPITNYKHKRVVSVEMKQDVNNILFICVYMPFFDTRKRDQCMTEAIDVISMIEVLIDEHPNHHIIIGGDLNTEMKNCSPFDPLWNALMSKHSFTHCNNVSSGPNYTYRHDSLNQTKMNDHFLVSTQLVHQISNMTILDDGDNNSDHLPLLMHLNIHTENMYHPEQETNENAPRLMHWDKMSDEHKSNYAQAVELSLLRQQVTNPVFSCDKGCVCNDKACHDLIQYEYDKIVSSLKEASKLLPTVKRGVQKDWWTANLSQLRDQAKSIQSVWIAEGRPRHGATYAERLRVRANYKYELRRAKCAPKQAAWNRLHADMSNHDTQSFWKRWRSIYGNKSSSSSPVVNGTSSNEGIANAFQCAFEKNSKPNNPNKVADLDNRFHDKYNEFVTNHAQKCDCKNHRISLEDTFEAIMSLKNGKSADDDGVSAEHLKIGPLILFIKLSSIFNAMLSHGFVPRQFRFGTIIPLIKDKNGDAGDVNNYRGITISPIVSKVFERILKSLFNNVLSSSSYQFGFKSGSSTSHALFCLSKTIDYYIDHGSKVYCSFLDASKAFDRLIHSGLYIKLIDRNVPRVFLDILISWYDGLQCRVKWNDHYGNWFKITAGVRQGGILSPDFYNLYVDDLIYLLKKSRIGCYISKIFAAALFYADDMCVLSPSLHGLQKLLDICSEYCTEWDICLNAKKTKNMQFGKSVQTHFHPTLLGVPIDWVHEWKYLGVTLRSGPRFGCSVTERVKAFYRSINSILRVEGRSDDPILLQLIETHCLPILTYAIEIIHVANRDERRSLRVAYNSIFRKIFGYRQFESVTNLQHVLNRCTWEELVEKRKIGFMNRTRSCNLDTLVRAFC